MLPMVKPWLYITLCRYNDKRTPSWTDRILWRGFEDDERHRGQSRQSQRERNSTFASVQEVISSDHEPIYGLLGLPRECKGDLPTGGSTRLVHRQHGVVSRFFRGSSKPRLMGEIRANIAVERRRIPSKKYVPHLTEVECNLVVVPRCLSMKSVRASNI